MFRDNPAFSGFSVDDTARAKTFYGETLGLQLSEEGGLLNLHLATGARVLVYPKGEAHTPATYTVLNFPVDNLDQAMDALEARGVRFEQYSGMVQTDPRGVFTVEGQLRQAWFKDPAGNILSVLQVL